MKQDTWYCYNHPEKYPFEVHYRTEKQESEKSKYFQTLKQVKDWCKKHKQARISAASWQVFDIMEGWKMFIGLTKLYIGNKLIGDISNIKHEGNTYIFKMYDNKGTYKTNKLSKLDVIFGAGDKIVIPE